MKAFKYQRFINCEYYKYMCSDFYLNPLILDSRASKISENVFYAIFNAWPEKYSDPSPEESETYQRNLYVIKAFFPAAFLARVADVRVFAMRHVSPDLYADAFKIKRAINRKLAINTFCFIWHERLVNLVMPRELRSLPPMYDIVIENATWIDNDYHIILRGVIIENQTMMRQCSINSKCKVILKDCIVLYGENNISNATIMTAERHKRGHQLIWSFLTLASQNQDYSYLTVSFRSVNLIPM